MQSAALVIVVFPGRQRESADGKQSSEGNKR